MRLAVRGFGQGERFAEHSLVLDVSHQAAASVGHGSLVHHLQERSSHHACERMKVRDQEADVKLTVMKLKLLLTPSLDPCISKPAKRKMKCAFE